MSQKILTICDEHASQGIDDVPAVAVDVLVRVQSNPFTMLTLDLCVDCVKPLAIALEHAEAIGRVYDGEIPKPKRAARKSRAAAADEQPHESTLPYTCTDCDRAFATPQGRGAHRSRVHGYRVSGTTSEAARQATHGGGADG